MARLQQTQCKRVGSAPRLPDDVVAAIAAENDIPKGHPGLSNMSTSISSKEQHHEQFSAWSQAMRSFLKGKRIWRYVNGDFTIPNKEKDELESKFKDRIEEWDVKNHQVITFFRNSSIFKINLQFGNFETAKEIWDLLASRYTTSDLAHQYQIMGSLSK
ncbi:hypothetical protein AgCh_001136 [Apium graveolens]